MNLYQNAINFTGTFVILILFTLYLRVKRIISEDDAPTIARLTIDFVLPCLLLGKLPFIKPTAEVLDTSLIIVISEILVASIAYIIGRFLIRLRPPSLSVFILSSTFGSTAILGTAFLTAIFHDDTQSVALGLLISQMSVGIPAYFIMPAVSLYFTENTSAKFNTLNIMREIFLSPCIIAIIIGIIWSIYELPTEGYFLIPYFSALNYIGITLVFMIALLNGLALKAFSIKTEYIVIVATVFFVLIFEPICVYWIDKLYDIPQKDAQISFILTSMPSANSVIAYAVRYNTDTRLAATLVTVTALLSTISIPTIMGIVPLIR